MFSFQKIKRAFYLLLITSQVLFAQGGKGKISGRIVDDRTNEPLVGVNIRIVDTKMGATSDVEGRFNVINLNPAKYSVTASMIGYGTITQTGVEVFIDRTTEVTFRLKDASIQTQTVTILAERPKIIKDQTSTSATMDDEQIKASPVEGLRGIIDLSASFQKNAQGDYQVRGSGTNEVSFQVNGVEQGNSNTSVPGWGGGTKANNSWKYDVNPIGVQQMQLISGGFSAEYGNAQAGIVKVVMKEGAPKFSGEFRVEYRPAGQYHWGDYIYDKSSPEWQTWGNLNYWMNVEKENAKISPTSNIFTFLGMNSRYSELYNKVFTSKNASQSELARWDSLANREIEWAYDLWTKLHTPDEANPLGVYDYRTHSYKRYMLGFGGPLGKNPDLLKFFFSGEYKSNPTRIPSTEKDQVAQNYILTLTSQIIKNHKFKFTSGFQKYVGGLFSGSDDIRWAGISPSYKYFASRDPVRTELTTSQSFNWVYTLDNNSFVETQVTHQYEKYELPYKYLYTWNDEKDRLDGSNDTTGLLLTRGPWWDSRFTYYENIATDFFQDNRSEQVSFSSDYSNQLTKSNYLKAGVRFNYWDLANTGVTYNFKANAFLTQQGVAEHYTAFPVNAALYFQDKMEYEGMVANFGLRAEMYNFQTAVPKDVFNVFYQGTQGPGSLGSIETERSKTKYMFLPRLGLSFPVGENTAFRLQYGHFASMPVFSQALGTSTFYGWNTRGNPNLEPKKTINYEFGLQQLIDEDNRLDVAIYYNDRVKQIGTQEVASFTGNARNSIGFTDDNLQLFYYNSSTNNQFGSTIGIDITLESVTTSNFSYRLSYSLSQTTSGTYGSPILYPENAAGSETRITSMEMLASWDRTHSFRGLFQYFFREGEGFRILNVYPFENTTYSLTYTAQSGLPFTYRTSSDLKDVYNNRRYPLESNFDFNFNKTILWGSTKLILGLRIMNLLNNRWLTPPDNESDRNAWILYGVTADNPDYPRESTYLFSPYRAYRNVPRQIFFTLGVGI
ncbi:MAG: TonB-dependent receptor [Bacteroidota bacterium]|nr:TonB-dependent receptor [Ignavibacteria bacterium]MCU7497828.1 TonB-dependent receptor [Ignavibacteria bacterium]MCU7511109.1 TonB-dependent receptor [Ignavibacteria bacterium]MCU7518656.1 TonB-dependent receptor [Ignavibacteria bacterium]MCU7522941.1 TonB-dependent receptor [Ignavibacteria bacterium]